MVYTILIWVYKLKSDSVSDICKMMLPHPPLQGTAEAICRRIGVFMEKEDCKDTSFSGREFDDMTREEQQKACQNAK